MTAAVQEPRGGITEIKAAVRHAGVYGIGNIIAKALGFLMLPVYTHYLDPRDYGLLEILDLSMSLFAMFLLLGMGPAILRSYAAANSEENKRAVISTAFLFVGVTGVATFLLGFRWIGPASSMILGSGSPSTYLLLSFIAFTLSYIAGPIRIYYRALEASGTLVILDTISSFSVLGLNAFFIVWLKIGLFGILWSSIVVNVGWMMLWAFIFRRVGFRFSGSQLRDLLTFGLPLIFSNLAMFVLNFADRFFLQHLRSLDIVGLYAVGYKFGFMVNYLLVQPFAVMWQTRMYAIQSHPESKAIFAQIFMLYSALLTYAALGLALLTPEIFRLMVAPKFFGAGNVAPVVGLAYVACGVGIYLQTGMYLGGRTKLIGAICAATTPVSLALNYILIRFFGMSGAAWATLLSFTLIGLASYHFSQRVFPLDLPLRRTAWVVAIAIGLYLASGPGSPVPAGAMATSLKIGVLAAYPAVLWKLRLFSAADKRILRSGADKVRENISSVFGHVVFHQGVTL